VLPSGHHHLATTRPAVPSPSVATVSRITLSGTATLHGGELCRYDFALQWRADIPVHTRRTGRRRRGAPPIEETHGPFLYLCPAQTIPYHTPCLHSQTSSLEGFGLLQSSVTFLNISFLFSGWRGATLRAVLFQSLLLSEI
jgi:hypothetical protein